MIAFIPQYLTSVVRVGLSAGLLVAFPACNEPKEATVEGKVEFNGRLLKSGTIQFIGNDGRAHSAAISREGTYRIEKVPPGLAKIQVKSHARSPFGNFKGPNPKEDPKAAEPILEIPEKYTDAQKSGLTCVVKPGPGPHIHDIQLQKR